ncbi:NrfD/PsrC family molybdoenzyme membrane anchor subunit [Corynebacterium sp. LK2510]|uniref:NrfD/PsrC family molybdoenzyme membrane anchor subunit n=1 Tax=Corynebacterium sp. LK2510 TaxID=3110472 RepID=UPI0034D01D08
MAEFEGFDHYRPPEEPRRKRRKDGGTGKKSRRGEELMVPQAQFEKFDSYYGKPIVKFPPWEWPIGAYFFLGGLAGGSSMLAVGSRATGNKELARNASLTTFAAAAAGSALLVLDLGRPERLLNMFRVFKLSSPMNVGSWLLAGFSTLAALPAVAEFDDLTNRQLPVPGVLRTVLHTAATPAGVAAGLLGSPLTAYTAVLLGDTSVPAWQAARNELPALFVSSAACASGGAGLVTTSTVANGPARKLAVAGAIADVISLRAVKNNIGEVMRETLETGKAGHLLHAAELCTIGGGVVAAVAGRNRVAAAAAGVALMAGSCLTRFGILQAGHQSTSDPKYVVEPQRERLTTRVESGGTGDSITTAR